MGKVSETTVNTVLDALRGLADMSTVRMMDGRRVATIEYMPGGFRRCIAEQLGMPYGTAGVVIGMLAQAGLVQRVSSGVHMSRWVTLDGEFHHTL